MSSQALLNYGTSSGRQTPDLLCLLDQDALTYSQLRIWVFYFLLNCFVTIFHHNFADTHISYSSINVGDLLPSSQSFPRVSEINLFPCPCPTGWAGEGFARSQLQSKGEFSSWQSKTASVTGRCPAVMKVRHPSWKCPHCIQQCCMTNSVFFSECGGLPCSSCFILPPRLQKLAFAIALQRSAHSAPALIKSP